MKFMGKIGWSCFMVILSFSAGQQAFSRDFSEEIKIADRKVILGQYEAAKIIYQKIITSSNDTVVGAYAHYKLGALYKKQNEPGKARLEYERGLESLEAAGQGDHQIGKFLLRALESGY